MNDTDKDKLQIELREKLDFSEAALYHPKTGDVIYTIDVDYDDDGATVGIDIVRYPDAAVESLSMRLTDIAGQYEPGYFAFYEGDVILRAIEQLDAKHPKPDLVIVDGHGLAHPRRFGLACYVGLKLDLPAIGIAKRSLLKFGKEWLSPEKYADHEFIVDDMVVGVAIRLQEGVNPVFISPGNKIDIATSVEVIKGLTGEYRLPENLRRAHLASIS